MPKQVLFLSIMLSLSGCSLSPDYVRPSTLADGNYLIHKGSENRNLRLEELLLEDQHLVEVIGHAMNNNYDIRESAIKINIAREQRLSVIYDLIPQANISLGRNINMSTAASLYTGQQEKSKTRSYTSSLGVDSYEVDLWGRKVSEINAAGHDIGGATYSLDALRLTLKSELASTWYETLSMVNIWHTLDHKLNVLTKIQVNLDVLQQLNRIDPVILSKITRSVAYDRTTQIKLGKEIINRINKLEYLSGFVSPYLNQNTWKTLSGDYQIIAIPQSIKSDVVFERPDVKAAEEKIKLANGHIGMARAAMLPVVNIFAKAGNTSDAFDSALTELNRNWTLTPSLIIPIFSWPSILNNLELAHSQQMVAMNNYQNVVSRAVQDIKDSTNDLYSYKELVSVLVRENIVHKENFLAITNQYDTGYLDLYSYYEALDVTSTAQIELESYRQLMMNSTIIALKSIGG